jgi:hypothetical protein
MYLFNWEEIPGRDNERFIEILIQKFGINWIRTANIEKINDGMKIKVSTEKNHLSLTLNDKKTEVILKIDHAITDRFIAKLERKEIAIWDVIKINDKFLFDFIIQDLRIINSEMTFEDISFGDLIKEIAKHVYDNIELDGSFDIQKWLETLLECEVFLSTTKKRHRDHLLHACRIAVLGERILKKTLDESAAPFSQKICLLDLVRDLFISNNNISDLMKIYELENIGEIELNKKILQIWYLAALYHDIGYIYESFIESWKNIRFLTEYPNFKEFYLNVETAITRFEREFKVSDAHEILPSKEFLKSFDHGKIGACLIANLLGDHNFICDVAASITQNHTSKDRVEFTEDPLSFLLILLDELQEWQRPVLGKKIRDQALAEKITEYSPYIENISKNPELSEIGMDWHIENSILNIDFILDFGRDTEIVETTNFSLPMMLYLKYKNLQRLRVDQSKISASFKNCLPVNTCLKDLAISISFKSGNPLCSLWDRQCNILLGYSHIKSIYTISNWLADTVRYRSEIGDIKFEINKIELPRVFDGDFSQHILEAHEIYLRDSYIIEENTEYELAYSKADPIDKGLINVEVSVRRELGNANTDIPIKGIYTCIDECMIRDSLCLEMVDVDGNDRLEEASKYLFKLPLEISSESEENIARSTYALYIPFRINLVYPIRKIIKYRYSFKTDLRNMHLYFLTFNGRRKNSIKRIAMNINWNQNLAQEMFTQFLSFRGNQDGLVNLIKYLKRSIRNREELELDCLREFGVIKTSIVLSGVNRYPDTWADIEPYKLVGFVYAMYRDWRHD